MSEAPSVSVDSLRCIPEDEGEESVAVVAVEFSRVGLGLLLVAVVVANARVAAVRLGELRIVAAGSALEAAAKGR